MPPRVRMRRRLLKLKDYFRIDHEGTDVTDIASLSVTVSDQGESNKARIVVNNPDGDFNGTYFTRYDYIDIFLGRTYPLMRLLRGFIFDVKHRHTQRQNMMVDLDVRGPEHIIMRRRATEEYTSTETSAIIKDLIDTYLSDIVIYDGDSIDSTGVTYAKIQYQDVPIWSIFKNLAMAVDFYIRLVWDESSSKWKLDFKRIDTTSSGKTLNSIATGDEIQISNMRYEYRGVSSLNRQTVYGGNDAITGNPIAKQYNDLVAQAGAVGVIEGDPIRDDNITSSPWAKDISRAVVVANSPVRKIIACNTEHLEDIDIGETVQLTNSEMGIDEEVMVRRIEYTWKGSTPEYRCALTLSSIPEDLMKAVSKLKEDIDMLKANASDTSELERLLQFYETFYFSEELTIIAGEINDGRIWGHVTNGKWGNDIKWGDDRTFTTKVSV